MTPATPQTPSRRACLPEETTENLPRFEADEEISIVIRELCAYLVDTIEVPHSFEQLRTTTAGHVLRPLIKSLSETCHHPEIVKALLILKSHFASASIQHDDRGVNETRGYACEFVAWRFLAHLSEHELIEYLLHEFPASNSTPTDPSDVEAAPTIYGPAQAGQRDGRPDENTALLRNRRQPPMKHPNLETANLHITPPVFSDQTSYLRDEDLTSSFIGSNALEIAAVANAKSFLSQRVVQKIVNGIWSGDIVFWESLGVHSKKKAQIYNKRRADPYCRLRVPIYLKTFEAIFFAMFLVLYYAVLVERNPEKITFVEIFLYIWIAAFAYDELGEFRDAGTLFYATDFWSIWDIGIVGIGIAYLIARVIGLVRQDANIIDISFDILSLEALFLVPRVCSLLSLHPYFGTLIPCLKEMTKDFVKFLGIVAILFFGFLTTFTMLARDSFTAVEIWWMMINVFFGSSSLGFDLCSKISPGLGPMLMFFFVVLTNILLLTSLIAILSQSLTKVMDHAREEYLFQYSVFVLEASASRRLTYYLPPLNLIPLTFFRPLRLCIPAEKLRSARIILLKITHLPYIAAIWAYESIFRSLTRSEDHSQQENVPRWPLPPAGPSRGQFNNIRSIRNRRPAYHRSTRSVASISLSAKTPAAEEAFRPEAGAPSMIGPAERESDLEQLKRMLERLSKQVEELGRKVEKAQEKEKEEED